MIEQHQIITSKTAKVVTYGNLNEHTKLIWLVTHGYGFLAQYFIQKFESLDPNEHFVVVPEALNRFYLDGLTGKVGASWMTKENRDEEINDYILYLDKVFETFCLHSKAKKVVLGFSQGVATISRWLIYTNYKVESAVFWAGSIPEEVLKTKKLNNYNNIFVVGDEDNFIPKDKIETLLESYRNNDLTFSQIFYKGGHTILTQPLFEVATQLMLS